MFAAKGEPHKNIPGGNHFRQNVTLGKEQLGKITMQTPGVSLFPHCIPRRYFETCLAGVSPASWHCDLQNGTPFGW